ncbi:PBB2 [Scenedesmus sp. PABB004]|nr:PBB2 [Scenedesmus sp. PABB004]
MGSNAGGFSFELVKRNELLASKGVQPPRAWKTGTTIVGVVYKDGVVLAADTRSTSGSTVADKNCEKIHYIAPNIYCCGAGTAADTMNVTAMVSSNLELHKYATGRQARVVTAMTLLKSHLFRYQGHVSAALILGGVDLHGPHLFTIFPHGSTDALPYATMGSGSLNAMAVFEAGYKDDMTREEAMALAARAIRSGVYNDLGSGSNVDLCVITADGVDYLRNYELLQGKTYTRQFPVHYPPGTAPVLKEKVIPLSEVTVVEGAVSMETE